MKIVFENKKQVPEKEALLTSNTIYAKLDQIKTEHIDRFQILCLNLDLSLHLNHMYTE